MSRSPPPPGPKSCFPSHTPVTSTVTSVRSIQSCFAQPESIASVAAMRTTARDFIPSPRRRGRGRGWIDATEIQSVRYPDRRATIHLVSTDRQLTFCSAFRLFEAEHITGDGALDGPRPESKWVLAGTQYNSHRPLHR